jgi:hypothetical protein
MQHIKRSEAVRQIYSGQTFTMQFITADEKRGTGGDLIEVINWQIAGHDDHDDPGAGASRTNVSASAVQRIPNHDEHGTINIENPGNRSLGIKKIHIDLIQTFNGKLILNG